MSLMHTRLAGKFVSAPGCWEVDKNGDNGGYIVMMNLEAGVRKERSRIVLKAVAVAVTASEG